MSNPVCPAIEFSNQENRLEAMDNCYLRREYESLKNRDVEVMKLLDEVLEIGSLCSTGFIGQLHDKIRAFKDKAALDKGERCHSVKSTRM